MRAREKRARTELKGLLLRLSVPVADESAAKVPSAGFEPAAYCSGGSRSIP